MPLYEYRCSKCQGITEVHAQSDDAPLIGCSHCGQIGAPLDKILSRVAVGRFSVDAHAEQNTSEASSDPVPAHSCGGGCTH